MMGVEMGMEVAKDRQLTLPAWAGEGKLQSSVCLFLNQVQRSHFVILTPPPPSS